MKYPISEIFTSPQGEGLYSGRLMTFIRLAGCSVGRKIGQEERTNKIQSLKEKLVSAGQGFEGLSVDKELDAWLGLPVYTEMCTLWDGREFLCDTDFRTKEALSVEEILARIDPQVQMVCITGGEPLIHNLVPLWKAIWDTDRTIQIETSGSVPISKQEVPTEYESKFFRNLWVTVSPKKGVLPEMLSVANELKLLVDEKFDPDAAWTLIWSTPHGVDRIVWLQPVNQEHTVDMDNLHRCVELQKRYPQWRISVQFHKILGVR